jgi:hypothetical protein
MFDGLSFTKRKIEIFEKNNSPKDQIGSHAENAGFMDCDETYQGLKNQALENIFKSAPHLRGVINNR